MCWFEKERSVLFYIYITEERKVKYGFCLFVYDPSPFMILPVFLPMFSLSERPPSHASPHNMGKKSSTCDHYGDFVFFSIFFFKASEGQSESCHLRRISHWVQGDLLPHEHACKTGAEDRVRVKSSDSVVHYSNAQLLPHSLEISTSNENAPQKLLKCPKSSWQIMSIWRPCPLLSIVPDMRAIGRVEGKLLNS